MKKITLLGVGVGLALLMVLLAGCIATSGQADTPTSSSNQQEGIWVSGTGKVTVAPDIANISLGIQAQDTTVAAAQAKAAQAMNQVMSALQADKIDPKDIQTQRFNISQLTRYDQTKNQDIVIGYQVSNMVNVKIRDVNAVGKIIDDVANAGGDFTRISSVYFSVEKPEQYYGQARQNAMNDAKDKAQQLANLGGVTLGKITYISEGSIYTPQPQILYSKQAAAPAPMPMTPISAGETDITLSVQVVFAIAK